MAPTTAPLAAVAAIAGYIVTTILLRATGYPGDPADGPAITGAVIYAVVAIVALGLIRRRRRAGS